MFRSTDGGKSFDRVLFKNENTGAKDVEHHARFDWCAGHQGKFFAYHQYIFAHQDSLSAAFLKAAPAEAGIGDVAASEKCVVHKNTIAKLAEDERMVDELRLTDTPVIIHDRTMVTGRPPIGWLDSLSKQSVRKVSQSQQGG